MAETQSRTNVDVVRVMELCRDIEVYCAQLYYCYADIFSADAEIAALWKKTAQEEENHASQFVMAINLRRQLVVDAVLVDKFQAENVLNTIKAVYDGVRKSKPTIVDALRSAIKLEQKLEKFHITSVALFEDESFRKLFEAMMKADRKHLQKLEEAYKKALATGN